MKIREKMPKNTGKFNNGKANSGEKNCGDGNSGFMNYGDDNTGIMNVGNDNSGNKNYGNHNSGFMNCGNSNSGFANKCKGSNGVFCNEDDMNIRIFNKPSGMSLIDFYNSRYFEIIHRAMFELTEWVDYTDEEKAADHEKQNAGGYLKSYSFEEAWGNWWNKLTEDEKEIIQEIPNFDPEIFKDITGINVISQNWIIGIGGSDEADVVTKRVSGTKAQVKKYLVDLVKTDIEKCRVKDIDTWDHGTTCTESVEERDNGSLYAYGCWYNSRKDYTATPEMEVEML